MGLPFLSPKKIVSVVVARHGKPGVEVTPEVESPGSELDPGLKSAAEDMIAAIDARSPIDLAKALQAAFDCMESYPHEEGPHEDVE